jgi:hypothetical protein
MGMFRLLKYPDRFATVGQSPVESCENSDFFGIADWL